MQLIALLLIGFSLFTAAILVIGALFQQLAPYPVYSKLAGLFLIICLGAIQWLNLEYILGHSYSAFSSLYISLLYGVAPSFYLFSHTLLTSKVNFNGWQILHTLPLFISPFIPFPWSVPLAFLIGSGYLLWLTRVIYLLRGQRSRFKMEILALAAFFSIALGAVVLGFIWPLMSNSSFINSYSILIGLAFFAITLTLLHFPTITTDVVEAAQAAYVESTLKNIDRKKSLALLTRLMHDDKLYTLESLNLSMLAEQLQLTPHQLSELINTEFKQGFSKFIRQYRIEDAKKRLVEEPESSVLSIGLSVGFNTQSNFYSAFRDITGMAPGQFRKQQP